MIPKFHWRDPCTHTWDTTTQLWAPEKDNAPHFCLLLSPAVHYNLCATHNLCTLLKFAKVSGWCHTCIQTYFLWSNDADCCMKEILCVCFVGMESRAFMYFPRTAQHSVGLKMSHLVRTTQFVTVAGAVDWRFWCSILKRVGVWQNFFKIDSAPQILFETLLACWMPCRTPPQANQGHKHTDRMKMRMKYSHRAAISVAPIHAAGMV